MRLFVSYARVDKPFCAQVVDTLEVHETWYDQRLYAGQDWWKEIVRRLDWCEGFVYLLSPDSINSDVCRKEFELARSLGRHIFPALVRENTPLPDTLSEVQYVDLSKGITTEAVKVLLNSIYVAERRNGQSSRTVDSMPEDVVEQPSINPATVIRAAAAAMENGHYERAVFLLRQAKANGSVSRYINIDALLSEAELSLERQSYLLEAEREYRQIFELVQRRHTHRLGIDAFEAFRRDFPDYDPDNLIRYCTPKKQVFLLPASTGETSSMPEYPPAIFPLMEWCDISEGWVDLIYNRADGQYAHKEVEVNAFRMAKYPVTNAQFQAFVEDSSGYVNPGWWSFSEDAYNWRKKNPFKQPSQFKDDERPREMVSWYDALAYCNWLSSCLGVRISLPTTAQWQRALQGNDDRIYPWGNLFDKNRCNTAESELKMTTGVLRYPGGISPFGVYDMIGNVWEWCIDTRPDANARWNIVEKQKRVIRGGSYMSAQQRVHTHSYYDLEPHSYHASIGFRLVQNF